jgi:DNA-binding transcriptional ArsR family regulator
MAGTVSLLDSPHQVIEALHPLRVQILSLLDAPDSATGLAARMGQTRQLVNYHLRALEAVGLVELVEERPRRGLTERIVRRSHDVMVVDPGLLGSLHRRDRVGLEGVIAAATGAIRQAAIVAREAGDTGERVATVALESTVHVETPAGLRRLVEEIAEVMARHDRPGRGSIPFTFTTLAMPERRERRHG